MNKRNVIIVDGKWYRECKFCKEIKPYNCDNFKYKNGKNMRSGKDQHDRRTECIPCGSIYNHNKALAKKYASRPMPDNCECCGKHKSQAKWKTLCCDHHHVTPTKATKEMAPSLFRGWLCNQCNKGMGMMLDHPDVGFAKQLNYVKMADIDGYNKIIDIVKNQTEDK